MGQVFGVSARRKAEVGMSTVEMIAWGALGLLSLILPIAWLLWGGTLEDQKKDEAPQVPKGRETRAG